MVLAACKKQMTELTDLQKRYMDIVVNEYRGFIPYGEKSSIAERLGCSRKYLYDMDEGKFPRWTEERDRRLKDAIPFMSPLQMMAILQTLFEDKIKSRVERGLDMTGKDPLDIIDQARRFLRVCLFRKQQHSRISWTSLLRIF